MVDVSYEFQYTCTGCPAQARGEVEGRPFCLRLHRDAWCFAVSEDPRTDPACVSGQDQGFFRQGRYSGRRDACGCVPLDEAERIIRDCAEQFLQHAPAGG